MFIFRLRTNKINFLMKNENKIVELLAESLKKQDQMIDRQDRQEQLLNVLTQSQAQLLLTTKELVESVNGLVESQKETNRRLAGIEDKLTEVSELRKRIEEIERYVGMK